MPNIKSAKKRALQGEARRKKNLARKSAVKTAIKKVLTALSANEEMSVTKELLRAAEATIARAKCKGILHCNTAARNVSRLAKNVAAKEKAQQA
ncbi:MAG: 30S ribosomal protein S20 [Candidatus Dependentiae bacterium]|nr:30S ribosomal protein S20 [Candidatus Dependentiae bacterium]